MKNLCLVLLIALLYFRGSSQVTSISGTINIYSEVTSLSGQTIAVTSASGFNVCDKILVIQMKGASIITSNSISYGGITTYNNAGNYEFAVITNISSNVITLASSLLRSYTVSDKVQIVRVPVYNNVLITGILSCPSWNGTTGGILVFEASGSVTFNDDINVSGKGFSGGAVGGSQTSCAGDTTSYVNGVPWAWSGFKGEGIFNSSSSNSLSKGKNANGGGGGNDINGGGGGGSNYGTGGKGGNYTGPTSCPTFYTMFCGGIGGQTLSYSNTSNKIFLGGGGGGGHQNNGVGAPGGNGGGIVIIKAGSMTGNNKAILSDGNDVPTGTIDGMGGGGAGGTILLDVPTYSAGLLVSVQGGDGGSDTYPFSDCHGKGGGGGGGMIWCSVSMIGVSVTMSGGLPGTFLSTNSPCFGTSQGATSGQSGGALPGLVMPGLSGSSNTPTIFPLGNACSSVSMQLAVTPSSPSYTYNWSGPGITSPNTSATITINSPGVYSCSLTTCGGAVSVSSYTVNSIGGNFSIFITPSSATFCPGTSIGMTANGAMTYSWQPGNLSGTSVTLSPSSTTIYTVTGTNSLGCVSFTTVTLSVIVNPPLIVTPVTQTVCQGKSFSFSASGASSYIWQPGSITAPTVVFMTASLSTIFTVTGTYPSGCTSKATLTVIVTPTPALVISPASQTACIGSTASFSATGAAQYTWLPGGSTGAVFTAVVPTIATVYTVNASSSSGCTATATATLHVISNPTVSATSNPTSTCAGGTSTLTAAGAVNYTWLPVNLTGPTVVVSPMATVIYTLSGANNSGCTSTATVMVSNPVDPKIFVSGDINCTHPAVNMTASSSSTQHTIQWSGPGISGMTSSIVSVSASGIYSVLITNTVTNCSGMATVQVQNNIGPLSFSIIPSGTLACFPGPAINMLISAPAHYTWYPSSLVTPSTGPLVSVNPSVTTSYTVQASLGVCSGSAEITVSVNVTPTVFATPLKDTICAGIAVPLYAEGASTFNWDPGNLAGDTVIVSPPVTTVYTLTGSNYNCTATGELTVTVLPSPQLTVSASPYLLCVGNTSTLTVSGAETMAWLISDLPPPTPTVVVSPLVNTTYTAVGTNSLGCLSTATLDLFVISGSSVSAESSASLICSGESVSLSVSGSSSYTWLPMGSTGQTVVHSPAVSTTYTVVTNTGGCGTYTTVTVNVNNCGNRTFGMTNAASQPQLYMGEFFRISFTVTAVNHSSQDLINVDLLDELHKTFVSPCSYTLLSRPRVFPSTSRLSVNPLFDGQFSQSLTSPSASTLNANSRDTIQFTVLLQPGGFSGDLYNTVIGSAERPDQTRVTDSSNNGFLWDPDNDGDPTNNDTLTILHIPPTDLFIPEGFSPDGDGVNDLFYIKGLDGRNVKLEVFNRWGNKVYEHGSYDNTWDGRANAGILFLSNNKLPQGTYYYILRFTEGGQDVIKGFVVLRY